jgi:hypothetical protein
VVTPEEVTKIFESVVPGIVSYVDRQLELIRQQRGPAYGLESVLLVGGFSRSRYLRQRLADHLEGIARLVTPADAAEAVLCGAVHYAHDPRVIKSRRAKYTYGLELSNRYDPVKHADRPSRTSGLGVWVDGVFAKVVGVNQSVDAEEEYPKIVFPTEIDQTRLAIDVYRSSDTDPTYTDDPGCEKTQRVHPGYLGYGGPPVHRTRIRRLPPVRAHPD